MKINKIYKFLFHTLRGRLILSVALVHAVMMSVFIIDLISREREMILNHQEEDALAVSRSLSVSSAGWLSSDDIAGLQEIVDNQLHYPELLFAILTDENGHVLASTNKSQNGKYLLDLPKEVKMKVISKTPEMVDIAVPVMLNNQLVGWARVGMGQLATNVALAKIKFNGISYTLLTILIGSIIAWIMGIRITKRLYLVQETINKVSQGNAKARVKVYGKDEAALLAKEFNTMLDTLSDKDTKLTKSKESFEKLFNLSAVPLALINKEGKVLGFNESFNKSFGYILKDVPSVKEWYQLAFPDPKYRKRAIEKWEKEVQLAIKENTNVRAKEYEVTCKNNEVRISVISGTIIDEEILVTFFDITERKKAEQELRKAKIKAEESDLLKSAFLANMSHEIRTPMNGILGFAELLKTPNLSGEKQQNYISIIEKSGVRMLNIINDIVDISKIDSGLMKVDITETNINDQIEFIYTFFKPEVLGKGMQFLLKNSLTSEEAIMNTDREKVYAILTNLIKNAIKYSNEGFIELGCELKDKYIEFYVKDTGIGIPKERKEAIFERFIQADIHDKKALEGAGLGLAITKAYVKMLNGEIWVETEEGKGSTFYFTIPYNVEKSNNKLKEEIQAEENYPELKKIKVLIAEDDEISDLYLTILLNKFTVDIFHAINGEEAVEKCKNMSDLDLIFMDIKMPKMNGYEAISEIRKFNKDIIIIAQTAYALSGDKEKAFEVGCSEYLKKPINKNEIETLIQKYFNK